MWTKAQHWWRGLSRRRRLGALCAALLGLGGLLPWSGQLICRLAFAPVAIFLLWRAAKWLLQLCIWRLRYRLLVTYIFIGLVPIVLISVLAVTATEMLTQQISAYLAGRELDRRLNALDGLAATLEAEPDRDTSAALARLLPYYEQHFPGLHVLIESNGLIRRPETANLPPLAANWPAHTGIVQRKGEFFACARRVSGHRRVTLAAPLTADWLSELLPGLGDVRLGLFSDNPFSEGVRSHTRSGKTHLPPPVNRFDRAVVWGTARVVRQWDQPNKNEPGLLTVSTRPSALYHLLFDSTPENVGPIPSNVLSIVFAIFAAVLIVMEAISLLIGVSLTRTITGTVHELYAGTQRIMEGNFHHRIRVKGKDQLADLGRSFNDMTARVEELLAIAKEKERLQTELAIASEVQLQLYPKKAPALPGVLLTACNSPARMVSGDYYDYQLLDPQTIAIALGDVAGKGISAALLMANIQSSLRTQLHYGLERAAAAGSTGSVPRPQISTSALVSQLNQQLHAHTSPEKYATFFLGLYDHTSGVLTYTNAGHLPPLLFRDGTATPLEINGMVVGAFPFADYTESRLSLQPGDLVVWFTDGITEPENHYDEMFGEERLTEIILKSLHRSNDEIVANVMHAVKDWTGSPELQDDMTLLLLRKN